jgi:hypothetical protein
MIEDVMMNKKLCECKVADKVVGKGADMVMDKEVGKVAGKGADRGMGEVGKGSGKGMGEVADKGVKGSGKGAKGAGKVALVYMIYKNIHTVYLHNIRYK